MTRPGKIRSDKSRVAVLFSGGKDSGLALSYALKYADVKCLIIIISKNPESYMFHTPNISWAPKQAEMTGIPIIVQETRGEKEIELEDLKKAISKAKKQYKIDAVVTGAIESVYQASRVQSITNELGLECFNPLWQRDQLAHLKELVDSGFDIIIIGTFGEGLEKLLGRKIDNKFIEDVRLLRDRLKINPAGEGGEYESFIINAPYYSKGLTIESSKILKDKESGMILSIERIS